MIWRGPMATQALDQLLRQTNWGDLDYLVVDMPPGTGDIALTLSQRVPLTGAVIVTTPQDIALLDAKKGLTMFEKVSVPILGIVENMSVYVCPNCGHSEHIFGAEGGKRMAEQYKVDYLGALPLNLSIREQTDSGHPTVVAEPAPRLAATTASARTAALRMIFTLANRLGARGCALCEPEVVELSPDWVGSMLASKRQMPTPRWHTSRPFSESISMPSGPAAPPESWIATPVLDTLPSAMIGSRHTEFDRVTPT